MPLVLASFLDGVVEADPIVTGILIAAVVLLATLFVILRIRGRRR